MGGVVEGALCGPQLVGTSEKKYILLCTKLDQEVMSQRPLRASVSSSSLVGVRPVKVWEQINPRLQVECLDE